MPLPSSVQSIALSFTKGEPPTQEQVSHTQTIPLESMQSLTTPNKSVKIDSIFVAAFNNEQAGTIFTPSIVVNYENNVTITTSPATGVPNFIPKPPPPISLLANGETIRHTGLVTDVPSSTPLFIQSNPRGLVTGPEWFAVIKQDSTPFINAYAKSNSSSFFTPLGETMPVIYDNIVTTHITDMYGLFYEVGVFTHKVSSWDTSKVTNMFRAFWVSGFNSEINDWDVSNVMYMTLLFRDNGYFNKPLNKWNTSKVTNMEGMFQNCSFNQDISSWNTSKVTDMNYMFNNAVFFNQNISSWKVYKLTSKPNKPSGFDTNAALSGNTSYLPNWAMDAPVV
jgi:surface protein